MSSRATWLRWALGLAFVALAVTAAVGVASASRPTPPAEDRVAREAAAEAASAAQELRRELGALEARFAEVTSERDAVARRLDALSGRLWDSLKGLRAAVNEASETASAAGADVGAALAEAQAAARALAVLENRFEYHLRSDH